MKRILEAGNIYGRWKVLSDQTEKPGYVSCLCACGTLKNVYASDLRRGISTSCGCKAHELNTRHGMVHSVEYMTWINIKSRCASTDPRYGGRGIRVCSKWKNSFEAFLKDMGLRPEEHPTEGAYSIDRIDNDGDYSPSNCRWATKKQQNSNKSVNFKITSHGQTKTLRQWSVDLNINESTLRSRIVDLGWSSEEALKKEKHV